MILKNALVVDDHVAVRNFWTMNLQSHLNMNLHFVESSAKAIDYLKRHSPDFISLDLHFENETLDYLNLVKSVRELAPRAIVYVYTSENAPQILDAIKPSVNGIALKTDSFDEVFELVKMATQSPEGKFLSVSVKRQIDMLKSEVSGIPELSELDMRVLYCILEGYSSQQIADKVQRSLKTVELYRRQLRSKFKVNNNVELIKKAVKLKYDDFIKQKLQIRDTPK